MHISGFILRTGIILALLIVVKLFVDYVNFDIIPANPVITAFVTGVIFTLAIIYAGTLNDYEEGERIPGDLAASIKALYKDSKIAGTASAKTAKDIDLHIKDLLKIINSNFKKNIWSLEDISDALDRIDADIIILAANNLAPPLIIKLRSELTNIDKISNRIEMIMETTFLSAAHVIAKVAVGMAIITLLFVKIDPNYVGVVLFGTVSFLLIALSILIKDMDNPFEMEKDSSADTELNVLWKLEEYMDSK